MSRVRGSVQIARPVEVVFESWPTNETNRATTPTMTASRKLTEGPIGVGTQFEATVISRGRSLPVTIDYTGFERPRRIHSRSLMPGATAEGHIRCDTHPGRHPLLLGRDCDADLPARFAGPLIGVIGRRQEPTIWTGLKHHLEDINQPG